MSTATQTSTVYSLDDVSKHNTKGDLWMSIHNKVYNITEFVLEVNLPKKNKNKINPGINVLIITPL